MKKIILSFCVFIILIFLIPAFFSRSFFSISLENVINETKNNIDENLNNISDYDYSQFSTIKLLHKSDESIEEIKLDEYLLGVVSAEMPASFEQEALNAQAVVARTYTLYQIIESPRKTWRSRNL